MANRLTNSQIGNIVRKIYWCMMLEREGYTKEQQEKNKLLCRKYGDADQLTANIYEILSKIKINKKLTKMNILELKQGLEVNTPKGRGRVWLVTEYGIEIEKIFTIILYDGSIWEFTNKDISATDNITMGRETNKNK